MKIPKIIKLPSGKYHCHLRIGGNSYYITEDTQKAVEKKAYAIKSGYVQQKPTIDYTVLDAVKKYIDCRENVISPSTLCGYRSIQRSRFIGIHNKKCTAVDWQKAVNEEAKKCSPKTLRSAWTLYKSAVEEVGVHVGKVKLPQVPKSDRPYFDADDIEFFLRVVRGKPCEIGALLALSSLRRSEIMGLTWDRIDLKNNTIQVKGSAVFDENGNLVYKETNKNNSSARTVPIMIPQLRDALEAVEDKTGAVYKFHPQTLARQINAICEEYGMPKVDIHGLRHSFASLCYHLNIPAMVCQKLGGWSDPATMNRIYTHLYEKDLSKSTKDIENFFQNCRWNADEKPHKRLIPAHFENNL